MSNAREIIARVLADRGYMNDDDEEVSETHREAYLADADAVLEALADAGFPVEPDVPVSQVASRISPISSLREGEMAAMQKAGISVYRGLEMIFVDWNDAHPVELTAHAAVQQWLRDRREAEVAAADAPALPDPFIKWTLLGTVLPNDDVV